eukprot:6209012-Pleurochrysis_carterae.AAC.1
MQRLQTRTAHFPEQVARAKCARGPAILTFLFLMCSCQWCGKPAADTRIIYKSRAKNRACSQPY